METHTKDQPSYYNSICNALVKSKELVFELTNEIGRPIGPGKTLKQQNDLVKVLRAVDSSHELLLYLKRQYGN